MKKQTATANHESSEIENAWDELLMSEFATSDELILITKINGYNIETLESVLYCRTGLRGFDQLNDERNLPMDLIEDAIESYLNGNIQDVRTWMEHNGITLSSMLNIYILDHNPDKTDIILFVHRLQYLPQ